MASNMDAIRRGAISPITHRTDIPPSAQGRAILYILLGDTKISLDSHYEIHRQKAICGERRRFLFLGLERGEELLGEEDLCLYIHTTFDCVSEWHAQHPALMHGRNSPRRKRSSKHGRKERTE